MKCWTKATNNLNAFLSLVRAGLWEDHFCLSLVGEIDFKEVYRLAEEQSVIGLVAAGLEYVKDRKVPTDDVLTFVGSTLLLEQRNNTMNEFAVWLIQRLREDGIYTLLVKGQGVAQYYERPLWRASGDIDLLLDEDNYVKAKKLLLPIAEHYDNEEIIAKHQALNIRGVEVELHGRLPFGLSRRVDKVVDLALENSLSDIRNSKVWRLNGVDINLPNVNDDIIVIFTHFLSHFFVEGVGLRQICDWCRLLWTYKDSIDINLLERRLHKAGLVSEWCSFASLAVNCLGMPVEAMPFYKDSRSYKGKAKLLLKRIIKTGNMGHNNDLSYRAKQSPFVSNVITFFRRFADFFEFSFIFPIDAPKFFVNYVFNRIRVLK